MNIKPEDLEMKGYAKLDELDHKDLVPFIQLYMKKRTKYSIAYYIINVIILGLIGYLFVHNNNIPGHSIGQRFAHFYYGLAIALALLALHEYIHVLAYRYQGATNTSYDANLRKLYFMALADKFVVNRKEFKVVALAPFIVITTVLTLLLLIVNSNWTLTVTSILLAHTAMCSGDFGLLSYFEYNNEKEVVTYDDVSRKVSYFYELTKNQKTTE
jgi:hypothetical protein